MRHPRKLLLVLGLLTAQLPVARAQQATPAAQPAAAASRDSSRTALRQFTTEDIVGWKSIRASVLSNDGKWLAYQLAPNEGDAEVVIKSTGADGKEMRFPVGEPPSGAAGGPAAFGAGAPAPTLVISGDSKWVAFMTYPKTAEARRARQTRRPLQNRVTLVNLATGEKREVEKVRRFAFAGDHPSWIAFYGYQPEEAPAGGPAAGPAAGAPGAGGAGGAPRARGPEGADLILLDLRSGSMVNIGNVGEFAFDESGDWLAYTIDARDQAGNGVQLRNMKTDVVRPLDSDRALYRRLAWNDSLLALTVLRGRVDSVARDTIFSVVGITSVATTAPKKLVFDAKEHTDFPTGMKVSLDRAPRWSEDLGAVFFGIREAKKSAPRGEGPEPRTVAQVQPGAPGAGGTVNQPQMGPGTDDELPSLVLWHAKDPRLQSQQIVEESRDKTFSYLTEYRVAENKVIRLADEPLRNVSLTPHDRYAYGTDVHEYEQAASYNGRRYADLYAIDLKTGQKKLGLKKSSSNAWPSPDGRQLLYYGPDTNFYTLDLATGETHNITKGAPVRFADLEDDHNNLVPPPHPPIGWSKDASAVLLSDGWDAWKVPTKTGPVVNLTADGRKTKVRYQRLYAFESPAVGGGGRGGRRGGPAGPEQGIDLSKPLYFGTYGEWTKKEGLAVVQPGQVGAKSLVTDNAKLAFIKAKDADTYLYTRQTYTEFPDYYVANADLKGGRKITDANPQQKNFAWSAGTRLINYVSDKGDTLQGALYLPANYEPGKKYPLLVTIYEKRSQLMHAYQSPSATRTPDPTLYTSRGYAVLDPDIVYKVNDPGMSAVWCVVPAVKAAIATGIIDSAKVGLWGHSWGGYQTAFLVTQTDIFKAAIAGAPLTDMVSMYSSIYWNSGGTNQAIFEASQGRFKGNFTDNYEAYIRNSPVFHAKNVKTPLIILHNDKDGAVDFNQGVTYFNTLRQLGKDVIMLEYVGENHGLGKPVNQKDYAVRMAEWFDHYLQGKPAPDWMQNGIPRLKMEEHLKERQKKAAVKVAS